MFLVKGEMIGVFVLIELYIGFDVVVIKICVVKDGDYYIINGVK